MTAWADQLAEMRESLLRLAESADANLATRNAAQLKAADTGMVLAVVAAIDNLALQVANVVPKPRSKRAKR